MKIVILTFGSTGDVVPYIALASGLLQRGHQVTICTNTRFADMLTQQGIGYAPMSDDIAQLIDSPKGRELLQGLNSVSGFFKTLKTLFRQLNKLQQDIINDAWRAVNSTEAELIIFAPKAYFAEHVVRFLSQGERPVYIGFGSMAAKNAKSVTAKIITALVNCGIRAVLASGWGGLKVDEVPDNVYLLEQVPHGWLFPKVAAVIHHGGAGTTAAIAVIEKQLRN